MKNSTDYSNIINILKKNLGFLILIPLIFVLFSILITFFLMHPKYEASTQVLVNQRKGNSEMMAQEVQSNIQLVNTYSEIIKSPRILDQVSKKFDKYSSNQIYNMLDIETETNSQILDVKVTTENKKDSEKIANEIAKVFSKDVPNIMNINNVSILSKANGSATQTSPKAIINILSAFIIGLFLSIFIVVIKELLDKRITKEEEVESELNIPVLGTIQKLK
ncbi:Wzz/FepE/Etk N-terminal domain-containing protein [Staphylococcus ureilyticus]|uniref:Wzz/FepE/Etk N-terminal domain-containing protein n=1 Tax=Staphylococcus ureilyticus TaxID=94138 RepID=UPI00321B92C8